MEPNFTVTELLFLNVIDGHGDDDEYYLRGPYFLQSL